MFSNLGFVLKEHTSNGGKIHNLAKKELQKTYKGSILGLGWAFVRPTLYIFIYWFALKIGLRHGGEQEGVPFIAWLAAGIAPWFFISDTLTFGGTSIRGQSYLVTKMKFPISIIPTYRILSQWYIHLAFLIVITTIIVVAGVRPSVYWLQIPYFVVCTFLFMTILSWTTSTLVTLSRDFEQLLRAIASIMFWLVPAIWNIDGISPLLQKVISLNPMVYLIEGYRMAFLNEGWFFSQWEYSLYFWASLFILALIGTFLHTKLRPQFADIL